MECRVCNNKIEIEESISDKAIEDLKLKDAPQKIKAGTINIYRCNFCSHIQIDTHIDSSYYETYEMNEEPKENDTRGRFSKNLYEYFEEKILQFSKYSKRNDLIIDVGCGTGTIMNIEDKYWVNVLGIEPSKAEYSIGIKNGHNIINDFFSRQLELERKVGKISAFSFIHVIEHLEELENILKYTYDILEDEGIGYIDVPNGEKIYKEKGYYDVIFEHINYFTPLSLCMLLSKIGFEIIELGQGFEENHIYSFVRKRTSNYKTFNEKIQMDRKILNNSINNHKRITIWGCGTKAQSYIHHIDNKSNILFFVDSSETKQGKYLCDFPLPIEKPNEKIVSNSDLIIIFATVYTDEIIKLLKEKYKYNGDILRFDGVVREEKIE